MDKLKYVKLERPDGSYSESIPLVVDSNYVDMDNGYSIQDNIGDIDLEADGQIINQLTNQYIEEIICNKYYSETYKTYYYIAYIPYKDKRGTIIEVQHGFAKDEISQNCKANETVRSFVKRHNATFAINASIFGTDSNKNNYEHAVGTIIHNGQLISNYESEGTWSESKISTLAWNEDRNFKVFPYGTAPEVILSEGYTESIGAFKQVIQNGININTIENSLYQWVILGQNTRTKDLYILACDGKKLINTENQGMDLNECINILINDFNCDFGYRLDSGGSTSFVYKNIYVNTPTDIRFSTERNVPDCIYFGKRESYNIDDKTNRIQNEYIGEIKNKIEKIESNTSTEYSSHKNLSNQTNADWTLDLKNANNESRIIMRADSSQWENGFYIWDATNQKTIIRIEDDGTIHNSLGEWARWAPKSGEKIVGENDNVNNYWQTLTSFVATKDAINAPSQVTSYSVYVFPKGGEESIQFACSLSINMDFKPKFRIRNYQGNWTEWMNLYTDGEFKRSSWVSINLPVGRNGNLKYKRDNSFIIINGYITITSEELESITQSNPLEISILLPSFFERITEVVSTSSGPGPQNFAKVRCNQQKITYWFGQNNVAGDYYVNIICPASIIE